jgi:hypothetical protein
MTDLRGVIQEGEWKNKVLCYADNKTEKLMLPTGDTGGPRTAARVDRARRRVVGVSV